MADVVCLGILVADIFGNPPLPFQPLANWQGSEGVPEDVGN